MSQAASTSQPVSQSISQSVSRSAAQVLVDQLLIHGTDTIFCVPGESHLPVLDALYQPSETGQVRLISCRQEGGVAFMAEAHGKLTNKPGIVFVTRGPGAATPRLESTPPITIQPR